MKTDQIKLFKQFGLNENEAKVYLSMLETGHTSILKISQNTEIKRTSLYVIIENLINKDLVKVTLRGKKKLYIAEDPKKILSILDERRNKFESIMPDLKDIYNKKSDKPIVKLYEGIIRVKKADSKIKESKKEILWFGSSEEFASTFPDTIDVMFEQAKKNAKEFPGCRVLYNNTQEIKRQARKRNKIQGVGYKRKVINKNLHFLNSGSAVYDDKVLIISIVRDYFAVEIENKTIADTFRQLFELAWRASEYP